MDLIVMEHSAEEVDRLDLPGRRVLPPDRPAVQGPAVDAGSVPRHLLDEGSLLAGPRVLEDADADGTGP